MPNQEPFEAPPPPSDRAVDGAPAPATQALLDDVLARVAAALAEGLVTADVFFALQRATMVVAMAEGAPPAVAARLARDAARVIADDADCRRHADALGHILGLGRPPP